jgi:integrase
VERRKVEVYAAAQPLDPAFVTDRMAAIDRRTLAGARDYALLTLGLLTGRRVREIAGLQWQDVTIRGDRITLTWRRMKGGKSRRETLDAATSKILARWLERYYGPRLGSLPPDAPLWVSLARNGTAGHALSAQALADICAKHLGTSQFHALRHTTAVSMEAAGASVSDIQAQLDHSNAATTSLYLKRLRAPENSKAAALINLFGLTDEE